ncbi:MAG: sigma 54-interacting transcriptional regulator [Pseudomonadota bacterium]|uniref:sigma-54 dependent transcriptional regulator n=1 Tax=Thermithiobacillus tepidarius TaxID=929 RepID=UPI0004042AB9|nr:sigma-54 dependent transcriptional regulator [Thermithiobacillus tepidarius]
METPNALSVVSSTPIPERRKMLLLAPFKLSAAPVAEFRASGWDVHVAHDASSAGELIERYGFRVGLASLEQGYSTEIHAQLDSLMTVGGPIKWVALLSPASMQDREICKMVMDHFYDYHTLPLDTPRLLVTLGHAYGMASMAHLVRDRQEAQLGEQEMVGGSPAMLQLFQSIRKMARVDAPVLITGESGTGKELTALAIHERSARARGPFIAVNCGALPANLIHSELFGHEKGAFTGAYQRKVGSIEAAVGGTIFLDEIGDLPLDLQVNLLRFLQEKTITRLGGTESIHVDVRVLAATHVNLEKAVEEGRFREDLYYRLNVLHLGVPALRERREDIPLLAQFFFDKFSREKQKAVKGFSQQALRSMSNYDWPGNVRELINRVRRAMVMSEKRLITPADLGLEGVAAAPRLPTLEEARSAAEKEAIQAVLRFTRNNLSQTARHLGVSRVTLYRLIERYAIEL